MKQPNALGAGCSNLEERVMGDKLIRGLGIVLGIMIFLVLMGFGSVGIGLQPLRNCERDAQHYCTMEGGGHGG